MIFDNYKGLFTKVNGLKSDHIRVVNNISQEVIGYIEKLW